MDFILNVEQLNVYQGLYIVFDLNILYQIDVCIELLMSVNNVFDKKYYLIIGFFDIVVYGEVCMVEIILWVKFQDFVCLKIFVCGFGVVCEGVCCQGVGSFVVIVFMF